MAQSMVKWTSISKWKEALGKLLIPHLVPALAWGVGTIISSCDSQDEGTLAQRPPWAWGALVYKVLWGAWPGRQEWWGGRGQTHPLYPSLVHDRDFVPAGGVFSSIHGWDHEMLHSNWNLFCLALGNDASLVAPKLNWSGWNCLLSCNAGLW